MGGGIVKCMKMRMGELRRMIREGVGGERLALYVWRFPSYIKVVLYSPAELLALDWLERSEVPSSVLRGYASFHETDAPCNGAWEVSAIAGIGYGRVLYGLGYALVPGGRLMPDRHYSSKRAQGAWTKSVGKMRGFPLDDVNDPQTEDPNDDCEVQVSVKKGGPDPVLDVAYEGPAVDPGPMQQVHRETLEELMEILNAAGGEYGNVGEVEKELGYMLKDASGEYFQAEFKKYSRER